MVSVFNKTLISVKSTWLMMYIFINVIIQINFVCIISVYIYMNINIMKMLNTIFMYLNNEKKILTVKISIFLFITSEI